MDLIEMNVDCEGSVILCLWRSREYGDTTVSALSLTSGKWSSFEKHGKELSEEHLHSSRAGLTSREFYLNLIFAPGAFSVSDIRKVLNVSVTYLHELLFAISLSVLCLLYVSSLKEMKSNEQR